MRWVCWIAAASAVGGLLQTARVQAADLLVRSDLDCRLIVDGSQRGVIKSGNEFRLSLSPGAHRMEAVPVSGRSRWEGIISLSAESQALNIPLQAVIAREEAKSLGYWTDPDTHLTWTIADNGVGVSWSQATYYCRNLTLGSFHDWTLPAIDDLQRLFGGPADDSGHHVVGPLKLTGWEWSSSPGQEPGQRWALDFGDGGRASVVMGDSGLNRALCVRRSN